MLTRKTIGSSGATFRALLCIAITTCLLSATAVAISVAGVSGTDLSLLVEPSSSKLAGGTAKLAVDVLRRNGAAYVGGYQIKIFPYFFMNESGQFEIEVSEPQLQKMIGGGVVNFTGHAQAKGSEIIHKITATAKAAGDGRGALTFTVATDNGPIVFNTSYRMIGP